MNLRETKFLLQSADLLDDLIDKYTEKVKIAGYAVDHGLKRSILITRKEENSDLPYPRFHSGKSRSERIIDLAELRTRLEGYQNLRNEIDTILECMEKEDRLLIEEIYIHHTRFIDVAKREGIRKQALYNRVNAILRQALKTLKQRDYLFE